MDKNKILLYTITWKNFTHIMLSKKTLDAKSTVSLIGSTEFHSSWPSKISPH